MQIKIGALQAASPALKKILNADLPVSVSFQLSKAIKAIETELSHFEDTRQSLVRKHGTDDGNGNIVVPESAYGDFGTEFAELNNVEVEIAFTPISVTKLDNVKLSAVDLMLLEAFVTE